MGSSHTALASTPSGMPSLLAFADPDRITFGSDYPFAATGHQFTAWLDGYAKRSPAARKRRGCRGWLAR